MMHICTVATLCFPEKTVPRNYYYCVQDENSLCLCFKNMYRTLFVAIFTSTFIFSMFKSFHTYRNINISNQAWWTQVSIFYKYYFWGLREIHFPQFWCSARLQADADFTREKYDSGVKTNPNFTFPNFGAAQAGKIFLLRLFKPVCDGFKWKSC